MVSGITKILCVPQIAIDIPLNKATITAGTIPNSPAAICQGSAANMNKINCWFSTTEIELPLIVNPPSRVTIGASTANK